MELGTGLQPTVRWQDNATLALFREALVWKQVFSDLTMCVLSCIGRSALPDDDMPSKHWRQRPLFIPQFSTVSVTRRSTRRHRDTHMQNGEGGSWSYAIGTSFSHCVEPSHAHTLSYSQGRYITLFFPSKVLRIAEPVNPELSPYPYHRQGGQVGIGTWVVR